MARITEESALTVVEWIGSGVGRAVEAVDSARFIVVVRWILVVPAAMSGFLAAFYVVVLTLGRQSDMAVMGLLASALVGAPVLVVLFGAAMAPSHRVIVAWSVYLAGLAVAVSISWWMPPFLIAAAVSGACAAWFVQWWSRREETT